MGALEIGLIAVGVLVVLVSFVFGDKIWGEKEDPDIEEHKDQLKKQMDEIFEQHVQNAREHLEDSAKESLERYVEEAHRQFEVMLNETRTHIDGQEEQTDSKMRAYISQAQEESIIVASDTKEEFERLLAEYRQAVKTSSEQVIAEINNHHNDVTLLYSMINDKEEEVKQHAQMVEELQNAVDILKKDIKDVQIKMQEVNLTAGAVHGEFVSEIVNNVLQELGTKQAPAEEKLEETRIFATGELTEETQSAVEPEPVKVVNEQDVEELLQAIGQSLEKVVEEDRIVSENVIDELFEETIEQAAAESADRKAAENSEQKAVGKQEESAEAAVEQPESKRQEQAAGAINTGASVQEYEKKAEESESEAGAKKAEESESEAGAKKAEESESGAAAKKAEESESEADAKKAEESESGADAKKAEESESEATMQKTEAAKAQTTGNDHTSAKVRVTGVLKPTEHPSGKPEDTAQVQKEEVESMMASLPEKLIQAVEKSGTVSNEADMQMRVEVLKLYDKGCSSMEIAQQMKLGIGEVRMIIDLYSRSER